MNDPYNKRLLFAEDEPELLEIYTRWFQRLGYHVLPTKNGNEALSLCRKQQVDLVISDVRMAGADGIELARTLKSTLDPSPLIVFLTGFADISHEEAYDLGVCAILEKPIERKELEKAVARFVRPPREFWDAPPSVQPNEHLQRQYHSLETALQRHELSLGRGGMFVRGPELLPDDVPLAFDFRFAEGRAAQMDGCGIVRWQRSELHEQLPPGAGIEILHLEAQALDCVVEWISRARPKAFIPRE